LFSAGDRRKHPRRPYLTNVRFCLNPFPHTETLLAVSSDMSDSGMCMYTFNPLACGQTVIFKNRMRSPHQKAVVQWVKEYDRNFYKIGLMFHPETAAEDNIPLCAQEPATEKRSETSATSRLNSQ
jgi:hypothetical protein